VAGGTWDSNGDEMHDGLVNFQQDDYHCKVANEAKEIKELIEAGFEYVTEQDGSSSSKTKGEKINAKRNITQTQRKRLEESRRCC